MKEDLYMSEITHAFTFNVQEIGPALTRFSTAEFNDGEESFLQRKEYQAIPCRAEHIKLYTSTLTDFTYLAIIHVDQYRFVFHIKDDASLYQWKRQYEGMAPAFLAQQLLPPPPKMPEYQTFPMNLRALYRW
jgi:hypothetical protein